MDNKLQLRNSTVDFLVFTRDAGDDGIEVRVRDNDVWLTQKALGEVFGVDRTVVTKHLKNIFDELLLYHKKEQARAKSGERYISSDVTLTSVIYLHTSFIVR